MLTLFTFPGQQLYPSCHRNNSVSSLAPAWLSQRQPGQSWPLHGQTRYRTLRSMSYIHKHSCPGLDINLTINDQYKMFSFTIFQLNYAGQFPCISMFLSEHICVVVGFFFLHVQFLQLKSSTPHACRMQSFQLNFYKAFSHCNLNTHFLLSKGKSINITYMGRMY